MLSFFAFLFRFDFTDEVVDEAGGTAGDVHEFEADAAMFVVGSNSCSNAKVSMVDDHDNFDLGSALEGEGDFGDDAATGEAEILNSSGKTEGTAEDHDFGSSFTEKTRGLAAFGGRRGCDANGRDRG